LNLRFEFAPQRSLALIEHTTTTIVASTTTTQEQPSISKSTQHTFELRRPFDRGILVAAHLSLVTFIFQKQGRKNTEREWFTVHCAAQILLSPRPDLMNNDSNSNSGDGGVAGGGAGGGMSAEDRKRMRLLAWKRKQEQQQGQQQQQDRAAAVVAPPPPPPPRPPAARISVSLVAGVVASQQRAKQKKKKKKKATATAFSLATDFGEDGDDENEEDDDDDDDDDGDADIMGGSSGGAVLNSKGRKRRRRPQDLMEEPQNEQQQQQQAQQQEQQPPSNKRRRWDTPSTAATAAAAAFAPALSSSMPSPPSISRPIVQPQPEKDALDQFMEKLQEGAVGQVDIPATNPSTVDDTSGGGGVSTAGVVSSGGVSIHVSGSMVRPMHSTMFVTAEQIQNNQVPYYHPKDWLSDTGGGGNTSGTDDDEQQQQQEEQARRALIEALVGAAAAQPAPEQQQEPAQETATPAVAAQEQVQEDDAQLAVEVKTEKSRREKQLRLLQRQAALARQSAIEASAPELGPMYNDAEAGVMEEAERNLQAAIQSADNDALTILAAHVNKKKELKAVDHSKIDYIPFDKNLYIVPKSLASLSHDQVLNRRAKLKVRVRGHGAPAPVSSFEECGLSERILEILRRQEITQPFPVQAQCIPCIMAGRDVIGVAKTGSGKTLAYLLPMLRHILVQPPLVPNVESGPIGLVLAPARELAYQIHTVCKGFAKQLGLK
jgi:DEAD/DEAH box helicase